MLSGLLLRKSGVPYSSPDSIADHASVDRVAAAVLDLWTTVTYRSSVHFGGKPFISKGGMFLYEMLVRGEGSHVAVVGQSQRAITAFSREIMGVRDFDLAHETVRVADLVDALRGTDHGGSVSSWLLSEVTGSFDAVASGAERMSLFGHNVSEATIFREYRSYITPYRCGLRDRASGAEVVRISNRGRLQVASIRDEHFVMLEAALALVVERFCEVPR